MTFKQFEKQKYLNIETFRKNGEGVKTPVWFEREGETLLVWTEADSGKAKRIRRNSTIRVASSTGSGELIGEWIPAQAIVDESPTAVAHATKLMRKKYGFVFSLFGFIGRLRGGKKHTIIKIKI